MRSGGEGCRGECGGTGDGVNPCALPCPWPGSHCPQPCAPWQGPSGQAPQGGLCTCCFPCAWNSAWHRGGAHSDVGWMWAPQLAPSLEPSEVFLDARARLLHLDPEALPDKRLFRSLFLHPTVPGLQRGRWYFPSLQDLGPSPAPLACWGTRSSACCGCRSGSWSCTPCLNTWGLVGVIMNRQEGCPGDSVCGHPSVASKGGACDLVEELVLLHLLTLHLLICEAHGMGWALAPRLPTAAGPSPVPTGPDTVQRG